MAEHARRSYSFKFRRLTSDNLARSLIEVRLRTRNQASRPAQAPQLTISFTHNVVQMSPALMFDMVNPGCMRYATEVDRTVHRVHRAGHNTATAIGTFCHGHHIRFLPDVNQLPVVPQAHNR